jgi:hypothetical protein
MSLIRPRDITLLFVMQCTEVCLTHIACVRGKVVEDDTAASVKVVGWVGAWGHGQIQLFYYFSLVYFSLLVSCVWVLFVVVVAITSSL